MSLVPSFVIKNLVVFGIWSFLSRVVQLAAAMARISSTSVVDENWMWDITLSNLLPRLWTYDNYIRKRHLIIANGHTQRWCAGRNPGIEPARGPSGKAWTATDRFRLTDDITMTSRGRVARAGLAEAGDISVLIVFDILWDYKQLYSILRSH
jgi:hypothetical protein